MKVENFGEQNRLGSVWLIVLYDIKVFDCKITDWLSMEAKQKIRSANSNNETHILLLLNNADSTTNLLLRYSHKS